MVFTEASISVRDISPSLLVSARCSMPLIRSSRFSISAATSLSSPLESAVLNCSLTMAARLKPPAPPPAPLPGGPPAPPPGGPPAPRLLSPCGGGPLCAVVWFCSSLVLPLPSGVSTEPSIGSSPFTSGKSIRSLYCPGFMTTSSPSFNPERITTISELSPPVSTSLVSHS